MASALVNVPKKAKRGDVIEIRTLMSHIMETGYRRTEAFGAVATATRRLGNGADASALIRAGLQELAR